MVYNPEKMDKMLGINVTQFGQGQSDNKVVAQDRPDHQTEEPEFSPNVISVGFLGNLKLLPQRRFIVNGWLLRRYITAIFAPGGVGKTVFSLVMAVGIVVERCLLGFGVKERVNVLILNNEDDNDELERRLGAIMLLHGVKDEDVAGRLFYLSGYGHPHVIARKVEGLDSDGKISIRIEATHKAYEIVGFCKKNDIGVIFCDPFISIHEVGENANDEINQVVNVMRMIAEKTDAAICISHHIKKSGSDSESHAGNTESGRGASSLRDGSRIVWTLAKMSHSTAKDLGMEEDRNRMIRADIGKENFSLQDADATWFRMESCKLSNGDWVGVPEPKNLKPLFEQLSKDGKKKKWHPTTVAESLERLMGGKPEKKWTDIRALFMSENDLGKTCANDHITLISQDEDMPTRITNQSGTLVDYWLTKAGPTSPWTIHRQELN